MSSHELTLLVVSPNEEMLKLIKAILELSKHRILLAKSSAEGLSLAQTKRPDMILATSGGDHAGGALCRAVRQDHEIRRTPFVLMTTSDPQAYAAYFAEGCDQILPIPFKCADITATVDNTLKRLNSSKANKIHVLFKSGSVDFVDPNTLDRLLANRELLCFKRKSGVATVGQDRIRCGKRADYPGPERRQGMV